MSPLWGRMPFSLRVDGVLSEFFKRRSPVPRRSSLALWLAASSFLFVSVPTLAKEMQGRLGLGYNAQFGRVPGNSGIPSVSLKYGLTRDIALEGIVGIRSSSPSQTVTAVKFFKNIFYENNLNFYFLAGGGLVASDGNSGFEGMGGFGAEFFIPGIESLGFSVETGASFSSAGEDFVVQTMGVSFLNAGIHFYF